MNPEPIGRLCGLLVACIPLDSLSPAGNEQGSREAYREDEYGCCH